MLFLNNKRQKPQKAVHNVMVSCPHYSNGRQQDEKSQIVFTECILHIANLLSLHQQPVCDLRQHN